MTTLIGGCGIAAFLTLNLLLPRHSRGKFDVSEEHATIV
jgi:hypothetical protein